MGKKKGGFKKASYKVDSLAKAVSDSEDDEAIEQHLQSILEDEIDEYNSSKDKSLLDKSKKIRGSNRDNFKDDDEDEVMPLDLTSSEDEEDEEGETGKKRDFDFNEDEDIEDDDDDDDDDEDILGNRDPNAGIPDSRAWGKKSQVYHNTDYVDQDFGGFEGSDAEMAEQEEAEAKEIQKRLTAELDESDFLEFMPTKKKVSGSEDKVEKTREILKVDFDKLSIAEKRKLVERECPEVVHMLEDYKEKLKEARITREVLENTTTDAILKSFYQSKFHSLLNYCINISFYLYLRSTSPTKCKGHPVIKRILQFRRLLDELVQFDPEKYIPAQGSTEIVKKKKKTKKANKLKADDDMEQELGQALGNASKPAEDGESDEDEQEKRGITYAIRKNKGLTPRRKKEQRNPRVKHREKFRKATIRRKGQVRTARTETHLYEGEITGIKSHLTKSVKIK